VEVALQYVDDITARVMPFANNIYNNEGGTHITGFKTSLTRTLNSYAKKNNLSKEGDDAFMGDDVLEGLTAVISVKLKEVQFEGQTKAKLGSVEARGMVENIFKSFKQTFHIFAFKKLNEAGITRRKCNYKIGSVMCNS